MLIEETILGLSTKGKYIMKHSTTLRPIQDQQVTVKHKSMVAISLQRMETPRRYSKGQNNIELFVGAFEGGAASNVQNREHTVRAA